MLALIFGVLFAVSFLGFAITSSAKIVILLRIAIQQVSLFEKLLAVCYGGCFIAQR